MTATRSVEDLPDLLTRAELAEFTGISVATLARWAMDKNPNAPRALRLGAAVRYRKSDVLSWLDSSVA